MITVDDLVRREVVYCVSSLVHTLANGSHEVPRKTGHPDRDAAHGALWERGETQRAAIRELHARRAWLSDDQEAQAGLTHAEYLAIATESQP